MPESVPGRPADAADLLPVGRIKLRDSQVMKVQRITLFVAAGFVLLSGTTLADGQLHWNSVRKQPIQVRLIALAIAYPRTSFFANDEVFIAQQELAKEESRFIKLVYDFLPYQPPLSSYGLNYSLVHRINAIRDTTCDETLWEMRTALQQRRQTDKTVSGWRYASETPVADLDRRQAHLRCYRTTSDDYERAFREPTSESPY
jgi:hypothetical protein